MAYPTGILALVLEDIDRQMLSLKQTCQAQATSARSTGLSSSQILSTFAFLRRTRASLVAAAATPGIAQYARDQKNNQTLDVVAEFNAVIAAVDNATSWIAANFPKDGSGYLLAQTLGVDAPVERQFTPAQLGTFASQLDAVIATVN